MYEDKLQFIDSFIDRCDACIKNQDTHEADKILNDFISIFNGEIKNLHFGLSTSYDNWNEDQNSLELIKQKLTNLKANLKAKAEEKEYDLKIAEANSTSITNSNSLSNNVNISLSQVYDSLNKSDSLTDEDKKELKSFLSQIAAADADKDKKTIKDKVATALRFIADKGVDALIAAGPYLIQALK